MRAILATLISLASSMTANAAPYDWKNGVHGCVVTTSSFFDNREKEYGNWVDRSQTFLVSVTSCDRVPRDISTNPFTGIECEGVEDQSQAYSIRTPKLRNLDEAWDLAFSAHVDSELPIRGRGYDSGLLILGNDGSIDYIESAHLDNAGGNRVWFTLVAECSKLPTP